MDAFASEADKRASAAVSWGELEGGIDHWAPGLVALGAGVLGWGVFP